MFAKGSMVIAAVKRRSERRQQCDNSKASKDNAIGRMKARITTQNYTPCTCACVRACVRACVHVCVCVCVRDCVHASMCVSSLTYFRSIYKSYILIIYIVYIRCH